MRRWALWTGLLAGIGCGPVGIVAVRDAPLAECLNPFDPPGAFRVVYSSDAIRLDTSGVFHNRYLEPHRFQDTVHVAGNQGQDVLFIFGYVDGHCVTLADSLYRHAPNFRAWLPIA